MKNTGGGGGVAPAKDIATGWVVTLGMVLMVISHMGNCPVNADPLSGSQQPATSGAGVPTSWSGRSGSSLTEQIIMRHVYEQIRSLKFAYEENINQLMRKVDTIDMKIARHGCDYNGFETLVRKIESLDLKVNRLESSNVHRLEELSKTIHTKGIRQELAMDGLVQKVDENHERIKQKLVFAEKRLDTINSKMQVYETSFTRMESRLTDIDNEISDISNTLDDIKTLSTLIDDKHNSTQRTMKEQLQVIKSESASRQQLEELSSSVKDIGSRLNDSALPMVRDDENVRPQLPPSDFDRSSLINDLKAQVNFESMRIEDKITSMYNNLWSRFMSLETTAKHLLKIGNITRRQLREDFQSLLQSEARFVEPESQENYMNLILDVLKRMLQEHKEQMDTNLQMSLTSQNLFIDSINKSVHNPNKNEELKEMEITLSSILEKIIYTITNKTSRMDNRIVEVMQMIKEYKTQMMRSLSHLTKMVISLTEKNKEDKELFEKGMLDMTKMNEIIASGLQDLYEKFEIISNMSPACEETTKSTETNQLKGNEYNTSIETENTDNAVSNEETDRKKEKEQDNRTIKAEIDDVVKIYSENGSNIKQTNASYQVLNTTNSNPNNETTNIKKHISIVIPYEAIEDEENLRSRLQEFLNHLPVSKTEALILTNTKNEKSDSERMIETKPEENNENNNGQPSSTHTIHIALNDGVNSDNSTNYNNVTSNFKINNSQHSEQFKEKVPASDINLQHTPFVRNTKDDGLLGVDSSNKSYFVEPLDTILSSPLETKIPVRENDGTPQPNGDEKRFYDLDGNEDLVRSEEIAQEQKVDDLGKKFGDSMETRGNREVSQGEVGETSTVGNENLFKFPISIESEESVKSEAINSSLTKLLGSSTAGNETKIDKETTLNDTHSLIIIGMGEQPSDPEKQKLNTTTVTGKVGSNTSTVSTLLPTSSSQPTLTNIETTTKKIFGDKSQPNRRTRQDIKQLFQDMKERRMQKIQELENVAQENEMLLKELDDDINNDERFDDSPLARRDTSEHFRPITSSEEITNFEPQFDLLYDEQELPYSA